MSDAKTIAKTLIEQYKNRDNVEQLDEISKKTLRSYIDKAVDSFEDLTRDVADEDATNRAEGAYGRSDDVQRLADKRDRRREGIKRAAKNLAKEVEQ